MEKTYSDSRPTIPTEISRAVKIEAGHECAIKGCTEHTYLEIHHINENREDNRKENLILLCDKHHKMAHAGVIDRKSLHEYKRLLTIPNLNDLEERFAKLESLISAVDLPKREPVSDPSINIILEEGVLLGNRLRGTEEGNRVAQQIYSLARKHGDRMGLAAIDLLVRRDHSYSRTGLNALGILYDNFFNHVKPLGLIEHFKQQNLHEVVYYCALREYFNPESDFTACMKSPNFSYEGYKVACDEDYILSKYPNRGPSIVLDCLVLDDA